MKKFKRIFGDKKPVIGMIHLEALPGSPRHTLSSQAIIDHALNEAVIYKDSGVDAIMIENMHDVPYLNRHVGPEVSSIMAIIAYQIKNEIDLPLGLQVLAGANQEALAIAQASGADFIRAEGFVFGHIADEGFIDAQAGELLRYRKMINADHVAVFTDLKKKHSSHAITNDVSLLETAKAAEFFMSDGIIITGSHTGEEVTIADLEELKDQLNIPVIIGSGATLENVKTYWNLCDAMIIGSHFKSDGFWENDLDKTRIETFMDTVKGI